MCYSPAAADTVAGATPFGKDIAYMGQPQPQRAEEMHAAQPSSTTPKLASLLIEEVCSVLAVQPLGP